MLIIFCNDLARYGCQLFRLQDPMISNVLEINGCMYNLDVLVKIKKTISLRFLFWVCLFQCVFSDLVISQSYFVYQYVLNW